MEEIMWGSSPSKFLAIEILLDDALFYGYKLKNTPTEIGKSRQKLIVQT